MEEHHKSCFVIMPITDPDGYDKGHFRYIYDKLIKVACERCKYAAVRADDIEQANFIVLDIIDRILTSDLVICDLSSRNPNVMYELGMRHAVQKPVVLIKDDRTPRVFDIQGIRTVDYASRARSEELERDIERLSKAIEATVRAIERINSPVDLLQGARKALNPVRAYANRQEITRDYGVKDALNTHDHFDIIGLSAEVAITTFKEELTSALARDGFSCRFIILDPRPGAESAVYYESIVDIVGGSPATKRAQAGELIALAKHVSARFSRNPPKMQLKVIRSRPLLYNLWVASDGVGTPREGHMSVYSYDHTVGGPAFRTSSDATTLLDALKREFEYVWEHIAEPIDFDI